MATSTLHIDQPATPGSGDDPYTTVVTNLRIFSDGNEWMLDGSDGAGRYTESCWTFDSFEAAVAAMPEFVANQPANGVVFQWRSLRPRNLVSYHYSEDVDAPTWSVYREEYLPGHWDGDPIDGSGRLVSTHPDEKTARAEAERLYALVKHQHDEV